MQVNIKRLLSFLVVLAMVLSMTPVTGIPAIEAKAETVATEVVTASTAGTLNFTSGNKAMCDHCNQEVDWTPIASGSRIGDVTTTGKLHYYLEADSTVYNTFLKFATGSSADTEVCLHLNGKNLVFNAANKEAFVAQNNGKLNLLGNGTIRRSTKGALFTVYSCTMNIYGGTYILNTSGFNLSDADVAANKVMQIKSSGANVTLHNNASMVGAVEFTAAGKITLAEGWTGQIGKLEVLDSMWTGNSVKGNIITVDGSLTGTVVYDQAKMGLTGGLLTKGETKLTADEYCEKCNKYVTWAPLTEGQSPDGTFDHYYLAGDITSSADVFILGDNYKRVGIYGGVCLRLNGHTLTTASKSTDRATIYANSATTINIFGEGGTVINTGTAPMFITKDARVNLYGGTYISSTANAINITGSSSFVYLYDNAKIVGTASAAAGKLFLNDSAVIEGINHTSTTITAAESWTGYLKNTNGKYYECGEDGNWAEVTKEAEWGVFDPAACDGKAYCEVCGEDAGAVLWTAKQGADRIDYKATGEHHHYYLTGDLNMPENISQCASVEKSTKMCINLNGYDITYGGRMNVGAGSAISIFGDGNVTFTGDTTAGENYKNAGINLADPTAIMNLYGGTYSVADQAKEDGKPMVYGSGVLNVYNATVNDPVVTTTVGNIKLADAAIVEEIRIQGTAKVTVADGWSGTANLTVPDSAFEGGVLTAANGAVEGSFSGTLTCNGQKLTYQNGVLKADTTFNPETGYCQACKKFVSWTALTTTVATVAPDGTHYHYYVEEDMANTDANMFYVQDNDNNTDNNVAPKFCLYLNGKTLTVKQVYAGFSGEWNIMGDGTMKTSGDKIFGPYSGTINLYGGTYIAEGADTVVTTRSSGATLNVYGNAELQGKLNVTQGAVNIYDEAVLTDVQISGGKTTFKSNWTGSAVVNAVESLIENNTIKTANAYVENGAEGELTSAIGFPILVVDNALVLKNPSKDEFAPDQYNGYAYCDCEVCGEQKLVKWIDFNEYKKELGDATLSDPSASTFHFYLSDDLDYTGNVLSANENVIFNFNGHDINPVAEVGKTEITAGVAFSCSYTMVLMNTSEEMSTVAGWASKAGESTVLWINGARASSKIYLHDNVTLTTHKDFTGDAPIVFIFSNGGTFYMKGGVIDASGIKNTDFPTAVLVEGQPVISSGANCPGAFYMYNGEIKGGTSANSAGTIQIGSRFDNESCIDGASFYMYGGTISGGKGANGGNLFINNNAKEVVIEGGTITGGEATKAGGNIYSNGANLTIGENATISDGFIPFTNMSTFGIGGGNIYFANGSLTTSGVITGGTIEKFKGAGGNVFLDGNYGDVSFIMNGGLISNGKLPTGEEEIYGNADFSGQSYGANIRGYKVKEIKLLGGTIEGGIGGNPEKADGRDVYIACHDNVVTDMTIGDVTINGAILLAKHKLTLVGAPKITSVDGENGLSVGETVEMKISGLTEGAHIDLSNIVANVPFTVACDNAEALKGYFNVIGMDDAVLDVAEGQLMVIGVAIVDGENVTWYADNAAAVAAYLADSSYATGKYIQLGRDTNLVLAEGEYRIDLAGNVAGEVAITGTGTAANTVVHLFDSANTDFDDFRTVTVADTVTLAERDHTVIVDGEAVRFIIVTDAAGKTSAHRLDMAINGVNLNTDKAGLSYNAEYQCDETLADMISAYGVILSLKDMPGAEMDNTDQRTVLTGFAPENNKVTTTSSTVSGIFKDTRTAAKNAQFGKMMIYANAYIELDLDGDGAADILVADNKNADKKAGNAWSLYDVLLEIDQNWADYADDQENIQNFVEQWYNYGMIEYTEDFTNIYGNAEQTNGNVTTDEGDADVGFED